MTLLSHQCFEQSGPVYIPISLYNKQPTPDNKDSVVRSPKLAAMGVATLSGFILHLLENKTTPTIIQPAINQYVRTNEEVSRYWEHSNQSAH